MENKSVRKNIKKRLASIVLYILIVLVTTPVALTLLFQNPVVQTISARLVTNMLTNSLDQSVSINSIRLGFFRGIVINGLEVKDDHNNTMISIGKLRAMPIFTSLTFNEINFLSVELDSVQFNMGSYKGNSTINLTAFIKKLTGEGDKSGGYFKLFSNTVKLNNSSFNLFNGNKTYETGENSMDYADIDITNIDINISNFTLINDSLNFKINELSAKEKCGIVVKNMSCDFILSSKGLYTYNTILSLNNSDIDADFGMEYSNYTSFSYYIDSVNMIADIRPTTINMADIGYFADILFSMPNVVGITGKLTGPVRDMTTEDMRIKFGKDTRVSGNVRFTGLPDFFSTHMTGNNLYITTNTHDINEFYLPIEQKHLDFTDILSSDEQIIANGNFDGYYEDFKSKLKLTLSYGNVESDIQFKYSPDNSIAFKATVIGDSVNIGKFLKQEELLGKMSFNMDVSGKGQSPESISYHTSAIVTNADIFGYNYRRMSIVGSYFADSVIAELRVGDKNLMMDASATANFMHSPVFTVNSNIVSANLNKLNFWYDQNINISSNLIAKVTGTDINTMTANISLTRTELKFSDDDAYIIDSILLTKKTDSQNNNIILLNSDIADIDIIGNYNISTLPESILGLVDSYFDIVPGNDSTRLVVDSYANISVNILKPKILSEQFLSGVQLSPRTNLHSKLNFKTNDIHLNLSSNKIKINTIKLDSSTLVMNSINDSLICEFAISEIVLKDSTSIDSTVFGLDDFSLSAKVRNDTITYGVNWLNRNQELNNSGILEGYISQVPDSTNFSIGKADVYINDILWNIDSNNLVTLSNDRIFFRNFYINAGKSEFKLMGTIPKNENDSLVAQFNDWDLSSFDIITSPMNINLDGEINGSLNLGLIDNNPTLVSDISIADLGLNNEYLGDARILNTWDNTNHSVFIKSQIIRQGNAGRGEVFLADGYYYPFKKDDNLDIDVSFNRFKLKTIEPFVSSFVQELEGTTSGKLEIRGSALEPVITGSADMQRTGMRIVYLNTKYSFSNSIEFVKNGIKFDKLIIYDTLGNQANINGSLTHNYFKDTKFDVVISTPGLLFFNTSENMNDLYYGSAIASGDIKISGSPSDVDLSIDIKTKKGTSVVLPLNYSVEISDKDYIIFTTPTIDSITKSEVIELSETTKNNELNYNIEVDMEVTPVAQVEISLPDDMGTISARGNSNLSLDVNSAGKFLLIGDYIVEEGLFQFKIGNLVSKRFSLVNGGRISWSGNPYSANVSIKGMYKVKTSLSSLGIVIDSTTSYKNKVTVECYIVLTDELLNPNIKFEIKLPDLDPDLQRAVYSELDTTNTAMMNQQMISLLVLGTFNFNNAANVSLQSSYYNVIANQLSSMLSQISENVDIGLNYKPGDEVSQEEFEVALSTQLFDDRLTIDGNFGMTYDRTDQSASNIVGDVDIGYKLTPDGQWVLKVFNHSNVNSWYNYSNYDQTSPYTQGVGIAFRKDFNKFAELFESKNKDKKSKKKDKPKQEPIKPEDENNQ